MCYQYMTEQEYEKIYVFSKEGDGFEWRYCERYFCYLNIGISISLNYFEAFRLHKFHDELNKCMLVCNIPQEVLLFPMCQTCNLHIQHATPTMLITVL